MSGLGGLINRDDVLPFYEQLARIIANKISEGHLAAGKRLPTELDLAKDYAISRETVRQAIGILERRGLIIRRRAKGTFVAAERVTQDLAELFVLPANGSPTPTRARTKAWSCTAWWGWRRGIG
jgi:DNA-binding GntR family transcriptional regulator